MRGLHGLAENAICSRGWSKTTIQAAWFDCRRKACTKQEVDAWLRAHKKPKALKVEHDRGKDGRYVVARLRNPDDFLCFRYGPFVDNGRVRFLFAGNPKGVSQKQARAAKAACGKSNWDECL